MSGARRALLVVIALCVVAATVVGLRWWQLRLPADAVFRLDGEVYDRADLDRYVAEQAAMYGTVLPDPGSDEALRLAAHSLALSVVVEQAALQRGIDVSEAETSRAMSQFLDASYPGGRGQFVEALAAEGVSEADVEDELRRQLLIEQLYDEVTDEVVVDVADVRAAYRQDPRAFVEAEQRNISQIAVRGRDRARSIRSDLGVDRFATVARRISLDQVTAPSGGSLGFVTRQELQEPFAAAAFEAEPGEVFGPVKARGADYFYVGVVTGVRPARTLGFDQVEERLSDLLLAARGLEVWQDYLETQLRLAAVEYTEGFAPDDPTSLPATSGARLADPSDAERGGE